MPLSNVSLSAIARHGCDISVNAQEVGPNGLRSVLTVLARGGGSITIRSAGVLPDATITAIARDFTTRVRFEF